MKRYMQDQSNGLCTGLFVNSWEAAMQKHKEGIITILQASLPLPLRLTLQLPLMSCCLGAYRYASCDTHSSVAEPGADLQVGHGLRQAQGVKATVAGQRAIQPLGARGVGQPQRVACKARHTMSAPLSQQCSDGKGSACALRAAASEQVLPLLEQGQL